MRWSLWAVLAGFLAVVVGGLGVARAEADPGLLVEEGPLSEDEKALFGKLKTAHADMLLSDKARRYYFINAETKEKHLVSSELVFGMKDGMIGGEYLSYEVYFEPDSNVITFTYDAGTALRGEGSVIVQGDKVLKSESSCGTSGCTLTVYENGKQVFTSSNP